MLEKDASPSSSERQGPNHPSEFPPPAIRVFCPDTGGLGGQVRVLIVSKDLSREWYRVMIQDFGSASRNKIIGRV